jgi:hypothetical protein
MICPQCNTEYREGFFTCADCLVPLVEKPPEKAEAQPESPPEFNFYTGDFVDVVHTLNQCDFLTVKLALDEEGIPHNFSGDILLGYRDPGLARFFVPTEFKEKALEVLKNLKLRAEPGARPER